MSDKATVMGQPRLPELFNYAHVRSVRESGLFRRLILLAYLPFGIALVVVRTAVVLVLCCALWLAPNRFFLPPLAARLVAASFGVLLRYRVKSGDGSHRELMRMLSQRPLLIAANHCTAFDVVPFLFLHRVNVLLDHGFFELVRSTFQKVVGAIPLDQSRKHEPAEREAMRASIVQQIRSSQQPLLYFPEGWDTSGKRGILVYNQFLFSLGVPVVPVALRARVPLLPLETGVLGVSLWSEFVWLFFYPCMIWELSFLPPQTLAEGEAPRDFAARVQKMTAAELGVSATTYLNKDALRLRQALLREPSLRSRLHRGEFDAEWEGESKKN